MNSLPRAYLAGPEVFLPEALAVGTRKRAICAVHGMAGVFPLDSPAVTAGLAPAAAAQAIYANNIALIAGCDLLIANLTPFRGVSLDAGTAFEIGYACALGKPVFGYSNAGGTLLERVPDRRPAPGGFADAQGLGIEDFGLAENLMIEAPLRQAGGEVFAAEIPGPARFTDLSVFEQAVRRAAQVMGVSPEQAGREQFS